MKRIYASPARVRRERPWMEDLPDDPRDPDVVRVKALARANQPRKQGKTAAIAADN